METEKYIPWTTKMQLINEVVLFLKIHAPQASKLANSLFEKKEDISIWEKGIYIVRFGGEVFFSFFSLEVFFRSLKSDHFEVIIVTNSAK